MEIIMKCFSCQSENRAGVKYCEECGTHIAQVCPRCDSRIPVGKKFCGECGQKLSNENEHKTGPAVDYNKPDSYTPKFMAEKILTTRSSLEGERKLVTVFFCDVTGFTSLSESLDPETVHQIMDGCFKILMEEIHRFEGTINQFTGDGVMALFGAPIAHEDHAQRACHAALAIQESLVAYSTVVKNEFGVEFKIRIGLNSGPVVVGAIGDDLRMDYTAVGDTTNLAARMESLAEPGTILISKNTYRLVQTYFSIESLGEATVKGKEAPQALFRLNGASDIHSRLDASRDRGLTRYIGRKEELVDLKKTLDSAVRGQGRVVGIVGEAGVGKSRFVYEVHQKTNISCRFLESRCLQYSSNIPFLPIIECIESYFGIGKGMSEKAINQKLISGLSELDENLISLMPAFRDFLSLPVQDPDWETLDPKEKRGLIFEAVRNFFVSISQNTPLILILDDLQWVDKTSEEFLNYFIEWIPNSKILLVLLYRQEYKHPWASKSFYNQIGIYPLSKPDSRLFIQCLLNDTPVSPDVETLLVEKTAGNPLFMEELTYSLLESVSIEKKDNAYQLKTDMAQLQVPDSIQGIVAGRMDRLDDDIKNTMQTASVIGRSFLFKILDALAGISDDVKTSLFELQRLELIYEKRIFPELEYMFKNAITQEVAYNSLLLNRRRQIHGSIAAIIETMFSNQLDEFYEIIAYHYSKSDNQAAAFKYLKLSGDKAIRNNSAWESFAFYKDALKITDKDTDQKIQSQSRLDLLHAILRPMIILNFPDESLEILEQGARLSESLEDCKSQIRFYSNIGFFHSVKGRHLEGAQYSQKAFDQATQINDITAMAQAAPDLCLANFASAKYNKVLSITSTMIHAIHKAGREKDTFGGPAIVYPALYSFSGLSYSHLGDFEKGMANCLYGLDEAKESSNLFTLSLCYYYPAFSLLLKGAFDEAIPYLESCLDALKKVDFVQIESIAKCGLGVAKAFTDDPVKGTALAKEGLDDFQKAGIEWQVSILQCYTGMCYYKQGEYSAALEYMEKSLESAAKNTEPFHHGKALIWKGRILGCKSPAEYENALSVINQGLEIIKPLNTRPDIAVGRFFMGELEHSADRSEKAENHLKKALAGFKDMGMDYWLKLTEALLKK